MPEEHAVPESNPHADEIRAKPQSPPLKGPPPPEKGPWDKADIVLKGAGALVTPLMVGLVGLLVSGYFSQRQTEETNARVYAELMSRREEADTNLRREMFTQVLEEFLQPRSDALGPKILKLELLAYNFHESFDLGPLFQDLRRRIQPETSEGQDQMKRLMKVATEIADKQVQVLRQDGAPEIPALVDFEKLNQNPGGFRVIEANLLQPRPMGDPRPQLERRFVVEILGRNVLRNELRVHLQVSEPGPIGSAHEAIEVDVAFSAGFFDFPGIDNTRLSQAERCAVVVSRMDADSADIRLSFFPAARASLKDKMYVEELVAAALRSRKQLDREE